MKCVRPGKIKCHRARRADRVFYAPIIALTKRAAARRAFANCDRRECEREVGVFLEAEVPGDPSRRVPRARQSTAD